MHATDVPTTDAAVSRLADDAGTVVARIGPWSLRPFHARWATVVASWVRDDEELFRVAPKTPAPITPQKVVDWSRDRDYPRMVTVGSESVPSAYGELHYMPGSRTHLWLGHLLVAPSARGRGMGRALTRLLLAEAFERCQARRVSLIVFPRNTPALRCYERAGLVYAGNQTRFFETSRRYHRMVAMTIDHRRYRNVTETQERT